VTRSLRDRLSRRHVSPYVWGVIPVVDPYSEHLKRAALGDHVCRLFPVTVKEAQ
jgi:hypothetical protein